MRILEVFWWQCQVDLDEDSDEFPKMIPIRIRRSFWEFWWKSWEDSDKNPGKKLIEILRGFCSDKYPEGVLIRIQRGFWWEFWRGFLEDCQWNIFFPVSYDTEGFEKEKFLLLIKFISDFRFIWKIKNSVWPFFLNDMSTCDLCPFF